MAERHDGTDVEPASAPRTRGDRTTVDGDAFPHAVQTLSLPVAGRAGAAPVVEYVDVQGVVAVAQTYPGGRTGTRMLQRVGQGLLDDAVGGQLGARRQPPRRALHHQVDR